VSVLGSKEAFRVELAPDDFEQVGLHGFIDNLQDFELVELGLINVS